MKTEINASVKLTLHRDPDQTMLIVMIDGNQVHEIYFGMAHRMMKSRNFFLTQVQKLTSRAVQKWATNKIQ